jgi:hypothetical protein
MIELTAEQWDLYLKKYKNLMWRISHLISGDYMLASIEDNFADLNIAAIESINGFHKKTGQVFDEMIKNKLFDQYTKTCLWTAKARKGIKLSERLPFRNNHLSIDELRAGDDDEGTGFDVPDVSASRIVDKIDAQDLVNTYDYKVKRVIQALEDEPELMTEVGKIKISPLAKKLGVSESKVKNIIKFMEEKNGHN